MSYNVGHSLPKINPQKIERSRNLDPGSREAIGHGRRFLDAVTDWAFFYEERISVVAQLRSVQDLDLPQVSFQYTVGVNPPIVLRDQDPLLARYGLL
ncbi:MAG: hypothetical protein ACREXR_09380 [Gammaproteobacteria bacterium]